MIMKINEQLCTQLVILATMLFNVIASELVINVIQCVIKLHYIVKLPYHNHAIILQIKTACFLLCMCSYTNA